MAKYNSRVGRARLANLNARNQARAKPVARASHPTMQTQILQRRTLFSCRVCGPVISHTQPRVRSLAHTLIPPPTLPPQMPPTRVPPRPAENGRRLGRVCAQANQGQSRGPRRVRDAVPSLVELSCRRCLAATAEQQPGNSRSCDSLSGRGTSIALAYLGLSRHHTHSDAPIRSHLCDRVQYLYSESSARTGRARRSMPRSPACPHASCGR